MPKATKKCRHLEVMLKKKKARNRNGFEMSFPLIRQAFFLLFPALMGMLCREVMSLKNRSLVLLYFG